MAGFFQTISEELLRPIYSKAEADLENQKNLSTSSNEGDIETDYIGYDPFSAYKNNSLDEHTHFANRKEMIMKWRKVVWSPEVDQAVNEIVTEAIVFDEKEQVIKLNIDDVDVPDKIKDKMYESFERIMFLLDFNRRGEEIFKKWYVDGQLNIEAVYDNKKIKEGLQKLIILTPFNIWKIKNEKTHEIKYIMKDEKPSNNYIQDLKKAERIFEAEQITQITSGLWSDDNKTPMSFLQKAVKPANQLNLLEDAVVIWHITRSPEKRVFYIDTGNLPKSKAEEYIKRLISKYRQKKIYNADSGSMESRSKSISILEDFWLPRNAQGRGTQIETLGAQATGMDEMTHVDYFVNKIYKSLNIPRSRRDQEATIQINNTIDVEKDELRFFKYILKLRRRFTILFVDLLKKDLLAKKVIKLQDWEEIQEKINFDFANNNPYSDIKQMSLLQMQMEAVSAAMEMVENRFLSKTWIRRELLNQTEEDIEQIEKELAAEEAEGDDVVGGGEQPPEEEPPAEPEQPAEQPPEEEPKDEPKDDKSGGTKKAVTGEGKPSYLTSGLQEEISELVKAEITKAISDIVSMEKNKHQSKILNSLHEGDIITNGTKKLIYRNGKLEDYKED